jgi:hypothetical protein
MDQPLVYGQSASFTVTATGRPTPTYQWVFTNSINNKAIAGATNSTYTISNVGPRNAGGYFVVVSNLSGSVTSRLATLTVQEFPHAATATASLVSDFMVGASITDGGWGYTNTPLIRVIGGGGSNATAVASVDYNSGGIVTNIAIISAGCCYTSTPIVVFDPPFLPNPVLGLAPFSFLSFSNLSVGSVYLFQQLEQSYYWSNQTVSFTATNAQFTNIVAGVASSGSYRLALVPTPAQAFATPVIVNGFIVGVTNLIGGSGYVTPPRVTFVDVNGSNATAVAYISGGAVNEIIIGSPGSGYDGATRVEIDPPPAVSVSPTVFPMMQMNCTGLAPYRHYQIEFKPVVDATWSNWNGGLFIPTDLTNRQLLFITNSTGFFRLQYLQ